MRKPIQLGVAFKGLEGFRQGATKRIVLRRDYAVFECNCGERFISMIKLVSSGEVKSCGCHRRFIAFQMGKNSTKTTHGMSKSREWSSWKMAKQRCFNPKATKYENWGGAGITMCDRWKNSFEAFFEDMGPRPQKTSLDRIDPFGNYEPGNCRWADDRTQGNNTKRKNKNADSEILPVGS